MLYVIFFSAVCLALAVVTIAGKDFWPLSHYPMFSIRQKMVDVKVWRIALEDNKGNVEWWRSEFIRYPEFAGRKLQKIYSLQLAGKKPLTFIDVERNKLLTVVMQHVVREQRDNKYSAIHIIERMMTDSLTVNDKTIDIIPLEQLNRGAIR